eukprot:1709796-Karenia_brevis.AAC.1
MEKLGDEVFLPAHTTSNSCSGKGFTVELHQQRVEQPLHIKGLDKNSLLLSGEVMNHVVESDKED